MKRTSTVGIGLSMAGTLLGAVQMYAQQGGNWSTNRYDAAHTGAPKTETAITKDSLNSAFKFLWKLKLGNESDSRAYSEPLLIPKLINAQGFKDFVIWAGKQDVYAVDSELGKVLWTKHYDAAPGACGSNLSMTMEAPLVINFGARRPAGTPPPRPQPPLAPKDRRIGVAAGGGGFGLKGLYVLTPDGMLHEQVITTGVDFATPVKFLPGPAGAMKGLSVGGKTMYTGTSSACGGAKNALYAVDMTSASYPVTSYDTKAVPQLTAMGPTLGDGVAYVVTGKGVSDSSAGVYANSVVAVGADGKPKAWYSAAGPLRNVTPAAFTYKQKKLIAAPGKDGSIVLLDAAEPGGADHHTALAESAPVGGSVGDAPDALSVWTDATSDATWIFASVQGPLAKGAKFAGNGAVTHGGVVGFKVEGEGDKLTLTPAWASNDLVSPTPPVVVNGLVISLAQGGPSVKAKLVVLDAATGKELYTSGDGIASYARMAGISVGDGHVFFVTHDGTLYSYGIGIEH